METHRLALAAGYRLEHFQIVRILGKGGFGITYEAIDLQLSKKVAIKELLPDSIATRVEGSTVVPQTSSMEESWGWAKERFLEEARFLAGFSHPAIVGVHRLIEANGTAYMVMDFVEGESYEARLRRIGKEPDQASLMAVMGPIMEGIEEIHAKNLLHRDIKPDNILIDKRGKPVLIDFGSARMSVGATMTMTSMVTHGYSPIEQYQTKGRMGPWTDIYAIGAVMCRAITGEKPPVAADRVLDDDFEWVSNRKPVGYDETFLNAVDWALRVRVEDRPQSVASFSEHLSVAKAVEPVKINIWVAKQNSRLLQLKDALLDAMNGMACAKGNDASAIGMRNGAEGSDAYDRDFALNLLSLERDPLFEIDVAIKKIETGNYGKCEMSGKPIPHARLEALPFARYTVECQSELEKNDRPAPVEDKTPIQKKAATKPYASKRKVVAVILVTFILSFAAVYIRYKSFLYEISINDYQNGWKYLEGTGVVKDEAKALDFFRKSAEQGNADAQGMLGFCYANGQGVSKDEVEAVKWFLKSAAKGNSWGQYNLGDCYYNGEGVAQDRVEAVKWYRKSAEQGNAAAIKMLKKLN